MDLPDLTFQIISWHTTDIDDDNEDQKRYLIKIFGVTSNGQSVSVNLLNYTPFFFIKLPHNISHASITMLIDFMKTRMGDTLISTDTFEKKDFWGFTNHEKFKFMRITLMNLQAMRKAAKILSFPINRIKYSLYESNIDPFLRMIHIRNISPTGWVTIKGSDLSDTEILLTHCQINKECKWTKIGPVDIDNISPLLVASFDIECTSTGGDFPVASKKYKKLAYEINEYIRRGNSKQELQQEIINAFDSTTEGLFSKLYTLHKFKPIEISNILKRHIDDIINISDVKYKNKEESCGLTEKLDNILPLLKGDPIIQIGTSYAKVGSNDIQKCVVTLDTCDDIPDIKVIACTTEKELILKWCEFICEIDPDVMIGYNIFGFDMEYMYDRAEELGIGLEFLKIGRIAGMSSNFVRKTLSSSALGDNLLKYVDMEGRVLIDLMKTVMRDHKLDSYKLDNVAKEFICGKIKHKKLQNVIGINTGDFVAITCYGEEESKKHKVIDINEQIFDPPLSDNAIKWGLAKDDITPKQIFEFQEGTSAQRAIIAKYCIQDCSLCIYLLNKLQILANNIGMSNVCYVPLSYIFMRGQGIKIFSLVAKQCRSEGFLIPVLARPTEVAQDDEGFEGAIVLEPKQGIYVDHPISVLDYASLYPSSMISENLSQDCYVIDPKYDNIPNIKYTDISYDIYDEHKVKTGIKTCRFAQNNRGMMPNILMKLLQARKSTRKKITWVTIKIDNIVLTGAYDGSVLIDSNGVKHTIEQDKIIEIKDTYNEFEKAVLDGLQNAYKVTANSLYGQCGARTSQIYMKEIAACTTATGRSMILKAKAFIEENYKEHEPDVIYGDSVTGDTPLLIKYPDGTIDIKTIDDLTDTYIPYKNFKPLYADRSDKQQGFIDAKIWAGNTWADIKRVIRHKTNKKIYRVNTFQGCIDVTEDHSLIDINGNEIKPTDCIIGTTEIMHTFPDEFNESIIQLENQGIPFITNTGIFKECNKCNQNYDETMYYFTNRKPERAKICKLCVKERACTRQEIKFDNTITEKILQYYVPGYTITKFEAWVMGFFFADGSCGKYECPTGRKYSWAINNSNLQYLEKARQYLLAIEPSNTVSDFKVLDTLDSSGVYKLVPTGSLKYMVEKYRSLFYDKEDYKKVPKFILNASYEVRLWFMRGYLVGDGEKGSDKYNSGMKSGKWHLDCLGKIGAQGLFYMMKSLGWKNIRINIREDKENIYSIRNIISESYNHEFENKVMKIFELNTVHQYVYDIETSEGIFNGGVGTINLKNTDSLFVKFNKHKEIKTCMKLSHEISHAFKSTLKAPHDLEFDKIFYPFILFSKKRYCANKYEDDDVNYTLASMGIALKRRDSAQIVKKIYGGILDIILNHKNIPESITFLKKSLEELVEGKFPMKDLILSKSLKSVYKDPTKIAHKTLADRIGVREPGNKPQANDRIPFIYIETKKKNVLQGERIEHPDFIKANNLKPDYSFYITNQLCKPICQVYALVLEQLTGYNKGDYYKNLYPRILIEKKGDVKKAKDRLQDLKEDEAKKLLFDPLLIKLETKKAGNSLITDYFK